MSNEQENDDDVFDEHADKAKRESQADTIIKLAADCTLTHTADGVAFATMQVGGHRETWPIRRSSFKSWLKREYYVATGKAPNAEAMTAALGVIEARAQFDGQRRDVHLRVAHLGDRLYIDLCDAEWRAIEIDSKGWRSVTNPPVLFRRSPGMLPLPDPRRGGDLYALRRHINVPGDDELELVIAWIQAALRDTGPFPLLVVVGEPGSAKSTLARRARDLIDPHSSPMRSLPSAERDLWIAAMNSAVLAFDNLSHITGWLSDALCRLATGGGYSTRELFTDSDELVIDAMRPTIMTGISDVARRPDLADRSVLLQLEPLAHGAQPDAQLDAEWQKDRPGILGALFDRLSNGLRHQHEVAAVNLPRMADFAQWTAACEYPASTATAAYRQNRSTAVDTIIEDEPIAVAIKALSRPWKGTAGDLLKTLERSVREEDRGDRWPKNAQGMKSRLRQIGPAMRGIQIDIKAPRASDRPRNFTITDVVDKRSSGSTASTEAAKSVGSSPDDPPTIPIRSTPIDGRSTDPKPAKSVACDDPDDPDDRQRLLSVPVRRVRI